LEDEEPCDENPETQEKIKIDNRCMCGEAKLEGKVVAVVIERD